MFETLYYIFVFVFLIIEVVYIVDVKKKSNNGIRLQELSKSHKDTKWENMSEEHKTLLKSLLWTTLFAFGALFGGLFTIHWPLWAGLIIYNIILISPINKQLKKLENLTLLYISTWINSVIGFLACLFVLVNKYHLHYNLSEIVENFLK